MVDLYLAMRKKESLAFKPKQLLQQVEALNLKRGYEKIQICYLKNYAKVYYSGTHNIILEIKMCICCPIECVMCLFEELCCAAVDFMGLPFALFALLPQHLTPICDSITNCMTGMSHMTGGIGGMGGYGSYY